jgi:hypothetical protein
MNGVSLANTLGTYLNLASYRQTDLNNQTRIKLAMSH